MPATEPAAATPAREAGEVESPSQRGRRLAVNTAFFSAATGASRIAGLVREIVAAKYFGVSGAMSSFTIAFQVPNLVRALFADAALQGAFVPVFTELLEKGRRREAFRVASSLFLLILLALGALTLLFELVAPLAMKLVAPGFDDDPLLKELTVTMGRILFPTVLILALSGVIVGMLNSFEHFSVPALAPLVWNIVIIGGLVGVTPLFDPQHEIYGYAWAVLAATFIQFLLPIPWLRGRGGRFTLTLDWRNPNVTRVLRLMLPVTIALGLINFSLLINSFFGTLVSDEAPAAIDKAFRIYQLPQGVFSIAIATVVFPTLARFAARGEHDNLRATMANGMRQIFMLLIPSAVIMAVLAVPITRLIYQRGEFTAESTHLVATAMAWWSISLPFQGVSLLFSRTFFSIQRPWVTTALSGANLAVNVAVAAALYPLGVGGVVLGTVVATVAMTVAQGYMLRRILGGIEGGRTLDAVLRMLAGAAVLAAVSFAAWWGLDHALGRALWAQAVSVGVAIGAGLAAYAAVVWALGVREARQIWSLLGGRLRRGAAA
ncbi:MAG: murein biosynthesis integral membrane protein MurJ [Thermoleophilaceae bacterium]|nr:murein biosynthesis integral membrane protein MurJ [Thermoleophilaceae bacterium]